jgi:hypothetical protein
MPSTSKAQHNAMEAAAHGDGKIGIPKKVGQDFVKADQEGGRRFPTAALAKAVRKPRQPKPDPEDEAIERGGYSRGHGVGSG